MLRRLLRAVRTGSLIALALLVAAAPVSFVRGIRLVWKPGSGERVYALGVWGGRAVGEWRRDVVYDRAYFYGHLTYSRWPWHTFRGIGPEGSRALGFAALHYPNLAWVEVPLWAPIIALGVPWAVVGVKTRRCRAIERRRRLAGLCVRCGYDLRASVDRCPECGVEIDTASCLPQSALGTTAVE